MPGEKKEGGRESGESLFVFEVPKAMGRHGSEGEKRTHPTFVIRVGRKTGILHSATGHEPCGGKKEGIDPFKRKKPGETFPITKMRGRIGQRSKNWEGERRTMKLFLTFIHEKRNEDHVTEPKNDPRDLRLKKKGEGEEGGGGGKLISYA